MNGISIRTDENSEIAVLIQRFFTLKSIPGSTEVHQIIVEFLDCDHEYLDSRITLMMRHSVSVRIRGEKWPRLRSVQTIQMKLNEMNTGCTQITITFHMHTIDLESFGHFALRIALTCYRVSEKCGRNRGNDRATNKC